MRSNLKGLLDDGIAKDRRIDGTPDYLRAVYVVVIDNIPSSVGLSTDSFRYELFWRRSLLPYRDRLTSDEYWQYMEDQSHLEELCRNPALWRDAKLRGIIDLREKPIRFEIVGRKFLPYLTEWDILMRLTE